MWLSNISRGVEQALLPAVRVAKEHIAYFSVPDGLMAYMHVNWDQ